MEYLPHVCFDPLVRITYELQRQWRRGWSDEDQVLHFLDCFNLSILCAIIPHRESIHLIFGLPLFLLPFIFLTILHLCGNRGYLQGFLQHHISNRSLFFLISFLYCLGFTPVHGDWKSKCVDNLNLSSSNIWPSACVADSPHVTPVSHFRALGQEPMTGQEGRSQEGCHLIYSLWFCAEVRVGLFPRTIYKLLF